MSYAEMQTFTGKQIRPLDPDLNPADLDINDIAHHLSQMCRWAGATRQFYSVAQHSVIVSLVVPPRDALCALLHDASEAYMHDVIRPIKCAEEMVYYREAEDRLQAKIATRFGLSWPFPKTVHVADERAWHTEARDLLTHRPDYADDRKMLPRSIRPMGPEGAKFWFLRRYRELTQRELMQKAG